MRQKWKKSLAEKVVRRPAFPALDAIQRTDEEFRKAGVVSHAAEAERLIRHFTGRTRLELYSSKNLIAPAVQKKILRAVRERKSGKPLSHVLGWAPFFGRDFHVSAHVLTPRPETERLLEEALRLIDVRKEIEEPEILDLGTGSGCLAASLTLERPHCRMTALDASEKALSVARNNFKLFGLHKKIKVVKSVFFNAFSKKRTRWDGIVTNPPYIPAADWGLLPKEVRREPRLALDGGPQGLEAIGRILDEAPSRLKPGGWLAMEIGDGQAKAVRCRVRQRDFREACFEKDLNGIERIVILRKR